MPQIHSNDYLVFERVQHMQAETEQLRRVARTREVASQRMTYQQYIRHLIGSLGTFFVTVGSKLQQIEVRATEYAM